MLGIGRLGDVGMQLAREPPERPLDLVGARVARDSEELVVVALCGRHLRHRFCSPHEHLTQA